MPLKNLEHDGTEDFLDSKFPDRAREVENLNELARQKPDKDEVKEKAQREYLSIHNPALWDAYN